MRCTRCGVEEAAMKTVRPRSGGASPFQLCDGCYPALRRWVWIIPGHVTVTARCDACLEFVNPREIVPETLRPAGWKEAYGGTCRMCAQEEA